MNFHVLKIGQRRDIRANVTTFPRVFKIILANDEPFLRVYFPTSRLWVPTRNVPKRLNSKVASLGSNITTFSRVSNYVLEKNILSIENSLIEVPLFSESIIGFSSYLSVVASTLEPKNTTKQTTQLGYSL